LPAFGIGTARRLPDEVVVKSARFMTVRPPDAQAPIANGRGGDEERDRANRDGDQHEFHICSQKGPR
jgi:hypothetical protein